ncbi:hypothetical protein AX17_000688 [Amanita inopinata Kibby_2008]|nr:hypothetical protein AX17_000688 [Amanita inopinata Kibby_2008]
MPEDEVLESEVHGPAYYQIRKSLRSIQVPRQRVDLQALKPRHKKLQLRQRPPPSTPLLTMSATTETDSNLHTSPGHSPQDTPLDSLSHSLAKTNLLDAATAPMQPDQHEKTALSLPSILIYTRSQLLSLHNSPLVQPPHNMPDLKDWFGTEVEQTVLRKDADASPSNSARERRFRRDAEDGDVSARPSFRSTISQPSQMGNFKHQSLRANDREKDRDRDGERDRDREGQERLRHLSDKYDRDRLALPLSVMRGKEREGASNSASRLGSHAQSATASSRRTENRDGTRKKSGEVVEDWRRGEHMIKQLLDKLNMGVGAEPPRSVREERADSGRRERDDRERPRSRVRDPSRPRRESSMGRRDRDEKSGRGERDRDDYRRDKERDTDKDQDHDDPRRWRDDGKRDERMAARHERDNRERDRTRDREKAVHDVAWDTSSDRRWVAEDRDSRSKRSTRDRKLGDAKDRDDRRDRERDREKEKEPAWMDTYIPSGPGFGILGGKGPDGELDGIQAWKRGMKEKEQKEKERAVSLTPGHGDGTISDVPEKTEKADLPEKQLDEIQLFKLLMKREGERKKNEASSGNSPSSIDSVSGIIQQPHPMANGSTAAVSSRDTSASLDESQNVAQIQPQVARDLLRDVSTHLDNASSDQQVDVRKVSGTKYLPGVVQSENSPVTEKANEIPTTYNPPSASRLLALGRPTIMTSKSPTFGNSTIPVPAVALDPLYNQYPMKLENSRAAPGFSPFEEQNRSLPPDELLNGLNASDAMRRINLDRPSLHVENNQPDNTCYDANSPGYPGPRGSRFAKFFDNKTRDAPVLLPKTRTPVEFSSPSPNLGQRLENNAYEAMNSNTTEHRTLEDIFTMLNNSSQGHRGNVTNSASSMALTNNIPLGQQAQNNLQLLQQAAFQQQPHQLQPNHRLEPLYESRLDDRNFVPDGMVPGLRPALPPRNRDGPILYSDGLDEVMHHGIQRQSQQRLDTVYTGPPPMFNPQRSVGIPVQQAHFRGGPSPISGQQGPLQASHRLPPGLANLGGRPPHDPSHFLSMPGVPSPNIHPNVPLNGPPQQSNFNAFVSNGGLGYSSGPQLRGPVPAHQLQNSMNHHPIGGPNAPTSLNPNQAQFLAMSAVGIGNLRGMNSGLAPQGQGSQLQNPLLSIRQQPQQQALHSHALPHMVPPHLSQQGHPPPSQPAHDLMALLMGGPHRE